MAHEKKRDDLARSVIGVASRLMAFLGGDRCEAGETSGRRTRFDFTDESGARFCVMVHRYPDGPQPTHEELRRHLGL